MARPRQTAAQKQLAEKKESGSGTHYAWSDLYNGGESVTRRNANGSEVRLIQSRNIINRGEEVSQGDLGVSDEEWAALIHTGSVRPYPVPDSADEYLSPHRAIIAEIVDDEGEIDVNKVMQLGQLSAGGLVQLPEPINPPADSEDIRTLNDDDEPAGA